MLQVLQALCAVEAPSAFLEALLDSLHGWAFVLQICHYPPGNINTLNRALNSYHSIPSTLNNYYSTPNNYYNISSTLNSYTPSSPSTPSTPSTPSSPNTNTPSNPNTPNNITLINPSLNIPSSPNSTPKTISYYFNN
ncbi:hypothetical protein B0H65DRAFT_445257 [Neurospora tetraspora]|uniref:Uncharacterized protein n=1 Tax=Neurospora tetraspora TaxID=94610 RepID=A0AAE0MNF4_9PEZI|nr:hypothetical protein B0H65DRAFT_445257 [Neurospora tetraspora]